MDKDAQKDFTCRMTEDEYFRYKKKWWISHNKSGKIGPMRDRSDFNEALTKLHRLHEASGEEQLAPILSWQYQQMHPSSSSSSTSWWQWKDSFLYLMTSNKKVRNWAHVKSSMIERGDLLCRFFTQPQTCRLSRTFIFQFVALQLDRLQLTVVCCNRPGPWTPHLTRRIFPYNWTHMRGSSRVFVVRASWFILMRSCVGSDSLRLLHFRLSLLTIFSLIILFFLLPSTSSSTMLWTNSLCTPANEDLGTFAEYDPPARDAC